MSPNNPFSHGNSVTLRESLGNHKTTRSEPGETRAARRNRERLQKKQAKKAQGMLNRIAIAEKKGDDEELARVKKEFKAWKEKFTK